MVSGIVFALIIVPIYLFIKRSLYVLPLVLFLIVAPWLILFIARLAMRHSIKCSARWGAVVVLGAIGGSWFLSIW